MESVGIARAGAGPSGCMRRTRRGVRSDAAAAMAGHLGTGDGTPPPTGIPPTRGVLGDRTPRGPQVMVEEAEPSAPVPAEGAPHTPRGGPPIPEASEGPPEILRAPPTPRGPPRGAPPSRTAPRGHAPTQGGSPRTLGGSEGPPRPISGRCVRHWRCQGAATGFGGAADGAQHPGEVRLEPAAARPPRHCHTVHFGNPVCCGTVNTVQRYRAPPDSGAAPQHQQRGGGCACASRTFLNPGPSVLCGVCDCPPPRQWPPQPPELVVTPLHLLQPGLGEAEGRRQEQLREEGQRMVALVRRRGQGPPWGDSSARGKGALRGAASPRPRCSSRTECGALHGSVTPEIKTLETKVSLERRYCFIPRRGRVRRSSTRHKRTSECSYTPDYMVTPLLQVFLLSKDGSSLLEVPC
ncbi:uncharacterized protein LOC141950102 [Strix uralensis]|uniref:uncharacterized protein LOC141950102 n=1 Tax=Strix uralensis TaxID=36305 RepID=UPI003DA5F130